MVNTVVHAEVLSTSSSAAQSFSLFSSRRVIVLAVQVNPVVSTKSGSKKKGNNNNNNKRKNVANQNRGGFSILPIIAAMAMMFIACCWVSVFLSQNPLNARAMKKIVKTKTRANITTSPPFPSIPQPTVCTVPKSKKLSAQKTEELKEEILHKLRTEGKVRLKMPDGMFGTLFPFDNAGLPSPQPIEISL